MKIRISILILVCALLLCSCGRTAYDEVSVGMTYDEFESFMDGKDVFAYGRYAFWRDENGDEFVVEFSGKEFKVNRMRSFSRQGVKPTSEDFENIIAGMGIFEVVERVGIPFRSVTSGFTTFDFLADDGTVYRINFDASNGYGNDMCTFGSEEYIVLEVNMVE